MPLRRCLLFLIAMLLCLSTAAEDDTLEVVVGGKIQRFDRAALAARLDVHTVTIDDPDYDAPVTFDGFALRGCSGFGIETNLIAFQHRCEYRG